MAIFGPAYIQSKIEDCQVSSNVCSFPSASSRYPPNLRIAPTPSNALSPFSAWQSAPSEPITNAAERTCSTETALYQSIERVLVPAANASAAITPQPNASAIVELSSKSLNLSEPSDLQSLIDLLKSCCLSKEMENEKLKAEVLHQQRLYESLLTTSNDNEVTLKSLKSVVDSIAESLETGAEYGAESIPLLVKELKLQLDDKIQSVNEMQLREKETATLYEHNREKMEMSHRAEIGKLTNIIEAQKELFEKESHRIRNEEQKEYEKKKIMLVTEMEDNVRKNVTFLIEKIRRADMTIKNMELQFQTWKEFSAAENKKVAETEKDHWKQRLDKLSERYNDLENKFMEKCKAHQTELTALKAECVESVEHSQAELVQLLENNKAKEADLRNRWTRLSNEKHSLEAAMRQLSSEHQLRLSQIKAQHLKDSEEDKRVKELLSKELLEAQAVCDSLTKREETTAKQIQGLQEELYDAFKEVEAARAQRDQLELNLKCEESRFQKVLLEQTTLIDNLQQEISNLRTQLSESCIKEEIVPNDAPLGDMHKGQRRTFTETSTQTLTNLEDTVSLLRNCTTCGDLLSGEQENLGTESATISDARRKAMELEVQLSATESENASLQTAIADMRQEAEKMRQKHLEITSSIDYTSALEIEKLKGALAEKESHIEEVLKKYVCVRRDSERNKHSLEAEVLQLTQQNSGLSQQIENLKEEQTKLMEISNHLRSEAQRRTTGLEHLKVEEQDHEESKSILKLENHIGQDRIKLTKDEGTEYELQQKEPLNSTSTKSLELEVNGSSNVLFERPPNSIKKASYKMTSGQVKAFSKLKIAESKKTESYIKYRPFNWFPSKEDGSRKD